MDNKTYVKLEQNPNVIIMVTAMPVENCDAPVVLELLRNATDSILVGTGRYNEGHPMHRVVSEMNDMVSKDALTALYNRRYVNERLPADIVKSTLSRSPMTLIFLDIDDLKLINDTFGHSAGDMALKRIADALGDCIRGEDWAARYGGDEFLICLLNIHAKEAHQVALRIKSAIADLPLLYHDEKIPLTISMGLHTMEDTPLTPEELILLADENLYKAKRGGKNIVVSSGPPGEGVSSSDLP